MNKQGGNWKVLEVTLSSDAKKFGRCCYMFHVGGVNLDDNRKPFHWQVPDLNNPRYDLSMAIMDEETRGAVVQLGRTV